jgi:hypothetical protein
MHPHHRSQVDSSRLQPTVDLVSKGTRRKRSSPLAPLPAPMRSDLPAVDESLHDEGAGRLPSWRSSGGLLVKAQEHHRVKAAWLREPCTYKPAVEATTTDLAQRLNLIFAEAFDNDELPGLATVVGACGYSSIAQMINDARRKGAERMRVITRALLAITAYYESEAAKGNRTALSILERIPQFDDLESAEQVATRAFAQQPQEHVVYLAGMERREDRGRELSPLEAANRILQVGSFEEIAAAIELEEDEDGCFAVPLPPEASTTEAPEPL